MTLSTPCVTLRERRSTGEHGENWNLFGLPEEMIEEQTARLLDLARPALAGVSPTVYVAALLGLINSALFYVGLGRGLRLYIPYLVLGAAGAVGGAMVGRQLPETGPMIGDVSIVIASAATWIVLLIARSMRV